MNDQRFKMPYPVKATRSTSIRSEQWRLFFSFLAFVLFVAAGLAALAMNLGN